MFVQARQPDTFCYLQETRGSSTRSARPRLGFAILTVIVCIVDPTGYLAPLQLALEGETSNYPLGIVLILPFLIKPEPCVLICHLSLATRFARHAPSWICGVNVWT